jgi:PIN domain nuclease of toxin-antitoxin system
MPQAIAEALSGAPDVGISTVTIWEVMTAIQKGRVNVSGTPEVTLRRWLAANPVQLLPLDAEIAFLSRTLEFTHSDPADRFIAATTIRAGATLATTDGYLLTLPWLSCLAV